MLSKIIPTKIYNLASSVKGYVTASHKTSSHPSVEEVSALSVPLLNQQRPHKSKVTFNSSSMSKALGLLIPFFYEANGQIAPPPTHSPVNNSSYYQLSSNDSAAMAAGISACGAIFIWVFAIVLHAHCKKSRNRNAMAAPHIEGEAELVAVRLMEEKHEINEITFEADTPENTTNALLFEDIAAFCDTQLENAQEGKTEKSAQENQLDVFKRKLDAFRLKYTCMVSDRIITNPCRLTSGIFEYHQIRNKFIETKGKCPLTNCDIRPRELIIDNSLKKVIVDELFALSLEYYGLKDELDGSEEKDKELDHLLIAPMTP